MPPDQGKPDETYPLTGAQPEKSLDLPEMESENSVAVAVSQTPATNVEASMTVVDTSMSNSTNPSAQMDLISVENLSAATTQVNTYNVKREVGRIKPI